MVESSENDDEIRVDESDARTPKQTLDEPQVSSAGAGWFSGFLRLLLLAVVFSLIGLIVFFQNLARPGPSGEPSVFIVSRGESLRSIASDLEERNLIHSRTLFIFGAFAYGLSAQLKAGEYLIEAGTSSYAILSKITEGEILGRTITFAEGLSNKQIVAKLMAEKALTGDIERVPPEGHILPTTIDYIGGQSRQSIIDALEAKHKSLVEDIWASRAPNLPLNSPEELVILASVVEKETGLAEERNLVAAVFINRLNKGMRLQSDPTIIYGLTGGEPLGRGIRRSELRSNTPYNTYVIDGLPLTAIANPGEAALRATAHPADTKALFFVADGTGGHAFAETLKAHQKNVKKWRAIEAKAKRDAEASN